MQEIIAQQIQDSIETKQKLSTVENEILKASYLASDTLEHGGKMLLCGNGGSAADAQHIAAELLVRYKGGNERSALPAIPLAFDPSAMTACGNDYGFDKIYSRAIEGLGNKGDLLLGISTSGNSQNILEAVKIARKKEMRIVLFLGADGGKLKNLGDVDIIVPSQVTARIQECHILIGHIMCAIIEKKMFNLD